MNRLISYLFNLSFRFPFVRHCIWFVVLLGVVVMAGGVVFYARDVVTSPVGWDRTFAISPVSASARNVRIASRGNFIAAVYEGKTGDQRGIYVTVSFNGGASFLAPIRIATVSSSINNIPHVAISSNGHLTAAWQDFQRDSSLSKLFYAYSTDMGATWTQPRPIFMDPETVSETEMVPQVFYDNRGVLHLFYHAYAGGILTLYHAISSDEKLFQKGQAIAELYGGLRIALFPSIYFSGRSIYIVWQGKGEQYGILSDDLFLITSSDYGESWSSQSKITLSSANDASPSIVLYKGVLYLAYQNNEDVNWSIYLLKGYEGGSTWLERPIKISTTNANCYAPQIVASNSDELVIFWYDTRKGEPAIFARKYSIGELKPLDEVQISGANVSARRPTSVSIGRAAVVCWEQGGRIVAKYSDIYVESPRVTSITHPPDTWRRSSTAQIEWTIPKDESGIVGFAAIDNTIPDFNPTVQNYKTNITMTRIAGLEDGVNYFHIRAVDGAGNLSRTIHYPLKVSQNPPVPPVVTSQTHPEGVAVKSRSPKFRWAVEIPERLKGFVYSLSPDPLKVPDEFTTELDEKFENLEEGRYFFKIRSIDKTNNRSRLTAYEIIVGKAGPIDPAVYDLLTRDFEQKMYREGDEMPLVRIPSVTLALPFDPALTYRKAEFDAVITARNLNPRDIVGYSIVVDTASRPLRDKINLKKKIVRVKGLTDGEYYLGVKAKYSKVEGGVKRYYWTKPYTVSFAVKIPPEYSPVLAFANTVANRLAGSWVFISLSLISIISVVVTIGFGSRVSFYSRLLQFRLRGTLRTIFFT